VRALADSSADGTKIQHWEWKRPKDGKSYDPGDLVTWAGSTWHCDEATTSKPGEYAGAKNWTLMVKRGRDGKDAK